MCLLLERAQVDGVTQRRDITGEADLREMTAAIAGCSRMILPSWSMQRQMSE